LQSEISNHKSEIMRIKICGITNLEDALAAIDSGADFLGFNFYPKSPRYLTPEHCAQIQSAIRNHQSAIHTVGIFVNESHEHVAAILDQCGLDLAQLHGEETPEVIAALSGRAFKAFRGIGERHAEFARARSSPAFLIDAYSPTHYGGTGHTADWSAARPLAQQYPLFLAGGLTPDNVADAIAQVQPWGVDVASGVESAPGVKDHMKVKLFVEKAKGAGVRGSKGDSPLHPGPPAPHQNKGAV
jgi:phosphoribosylanthranilate isomerase